MRALALVCVLGLSACATTPEVPPRAALRSLAELPRFQLEGRLQVRDGERSAVVGVDWQHTAGHDAWLFTGPLGQGLARIESQAGRARMTLSDGSRVEAGLMGDDVGLMAEVAGVCDVYCGMSRERPYGTAVSSQNALNSVRGLRGKRFSVSIVDQFVQCIGLYPVGTLLELNSGEVAVVVSQNRIRRLKPRVMILLGPDKKPNAYPQTLDLLYDPSCATGEPYEIVRALPPGAFGVEPSAYYLA